MTTPLHPPLARRRSPLTPRLQELGAVFAPFGEEASLVETLPNKISKANKTLALCDLSPLTRIGVKGQGIESLLKRSSVVAPKAVDVNKSVVQKDGSLCVRLAQNEVLLLSALDSKGTRDFVDLRKNLVKPREQVFSVPYQDSLCWLALGGEGAVDLLATMCAVDLREGVFAAGSLAQTSLARLSALVLRAPTSLRSGMPLFYLLADSAASLYLWDCLLDAMSASAMEQGGEHGNIVCGRQDLLKLLKRSS